MTTSLVVGWRTRTAAVIAALFLVLSAAPAPARDDDSAPRTPAELYPGLFERVQLDRVYEDGKTFVDAVPRTSPEAILEEFLRAHEDPGFDLRTFVTARFDAPAERPHRPVAQPREPRHAARGRQATPHWSVP